MKDFPLTANSTKHTMTGLYLIVSNLQLLRPKSSIKSATSTKPKVKFDKVLADETLNRVQNNGLSKTKERKLQNNQREMQREV